MHPIINYISPPKMSHPSFGIGIKATALITVILLSYYAGFPIVYLSSLAFGVVAAALADHPALYVDRFKALAVMLISFALAAGSVTAFYHYPILFALGIFSSTFLFVMLAGLEVRFGPIAMSALILAIYTMLGYGQYSGHEWLQPLYLLLGALSYILLSLLINLVKPNQSLEQHSQQLFTYLAKYQSQKAQLFGVYHNDEALRLNLAKLASQVSNALAHMRKLLVIRQAQSQRSKHESYYLNLFFKAQLLIERMISSHIHYCELNQKLDSTDIAKRLHFIMLALAKRITYQAKPKPIHDRLKHEITSLAQELRGNYQLKTMLGNVDYNLLAFLLNNLSEMERLTREEVDFPSHDFKFENLTKLSWQNFWGRLTDPTSLLFRHALRQALCMLAGYGIILLMPGPMHGQDFWLLLTTLLVIKPNYSATRQRLIERIVGTLLGIGIATGLLLAHLSMPWMISITSLSALLFFWYFSHRYTIAVIMITIFVALALQLLGVSSELTISIRIAATLAGGILVYLAVRFVWPDWLTNHSQTILNRWLTTALNYQDYIFKQYQANEANEDEPYRLARFHLHVAEGEVVTHQQALLAEPATKRHDILATYQLTGYIHEYNAHLSALALYRGRPLSDQARYIINHLGQQLHAQLEQLRYAVAPQKQSEVRTFDEEIQVKLRQLMPNLHGEELLIAYQLQQLATIIRQLASSLSPSSTDKELC